MAKVGTKHTIKSISLGHYAVAFEAINRYNLDLDDIEFEMDMQSKIHKFKKYVQWLQDQLREAYRDA